MDAEATGVDLDPLVPPLGRRRLARPRLQSRLRLVIGSQRLLVPVVGLQGVPDLAVKSGLEELVIGRLCQCPAVGVPRLLAPSGEMEDSGHLLVDAALRLPSPGGVQVGSLQRLECVLEIGESFAVREQPSRALACPEEVFHRLRARFAEVEVASQQVDRLVARPVERLGRVRYPPMELVAVAAEKSRIGDLLDKGVVKDERLLPCLMSGVQEAPRDELRERRLEVARAGHDRTKQREADRAPDHRGRLQERGFPLR